MTAMQQWTSGQWIVFALTVAAGLGALALAYAARSAVLGWTAPAPLTILATGRIPRATVVRAAARPVLPPVGTWTDPALTDYAEAGVGSLRDLLTVTVDPTLRTSAELSAEEDAWVNAYADLSHSMPETDAAREQMRITLEPAYRTARLWLVRAGEVGARATLAHWRMDTPTGEYPAYDVQTRMAHALLVS